MKSNNSSGENKAPRVPSPSFRFGSRQRPPDASTDEIVRFVREYQRCKPSPSMHNITMMKSKAVLPGIERKPNNRSSDDTKRSKMSDRHHDRDSIDFESRGASDVGHKLRSKRTASFERWENGPDNDFCDDDDDDDDDAVYRYDRKPRASQHGMDINCDRFDGDRDKQKRSSKPDVDFEVERIFNNIGSRQKKLQSHKRGSVHSHTNTNGFSSSRPFDHSGGAMRSCALRQLPPIVNNDVIPELSRPSAPSPMNASPTAQLSLCDSDEDVDGAQQNDEKARSYDSDDSNEDVYAIQQTSYKMTSIDYRDDENIDTGENQSNVGCEDVNRYQNTTSNISDDENSKRVVEKSNVEYDVSRDYQQNNMDRMSPQDTDETSSNEDVEEFQHRDCLTISNNDEDENNDEQSGADGEDVEGDHNKVDKRLASYNADDIDESDQDDNQDQMDAL